jgi:hypothetical protein
VHQQNRRTKEGALRRDVASAARRALRAASPRRPRPHALPEAEHRLRPCTARSPASRCSPSPEMPRPASPVRRTRSVRAADPRSIRGAGRTRAGRGAVAWRDALIVTPPSQRAALYKGRRISPLPHTTPRRATPLPPSPEHRLLRSSPFQTAPLAPSLGSTRRPQFICCPPRAVVSPELAPPR